MPVVTQIPLKLHVLSIRAGLRNAQAPWKVYALGGPTGFEHWIEIRDAKNDTFGGRSTKRFLFVQEARGLNAWFVPRGAMIAMQQPKKENR